MLTIHSCDFKSVYNSIYMEQGYDVDIKSVIMSTNDIWMPVKHYNGRRLEPEGPRRKLKRHHIKKKTEYFDE